MLWCVTSLLCDEYWASNITMLQTQMAADNLVRSFVY